MSPLLSGPVFPLSKCNAHMPQGSPVLKTGTFRGWHRRGFLKTYLLQGMLYTTQRDLHQAILRISESKNKKKTSTLPAEIVEICSSS